jgi:hypothetical protein
MVVEIGFGGWDTAEAVHEAVAVVSGEIVGGDEFDIAEGAHRAAAKRGVRPEVPSGS